MNIIKKGRSYIITLPYISLESGYITDAAARDIAKNALNLFPLPDSTQIEIFEGKDSVMIFINLPKTFYRFENFEDVIDACKNCAAEESSLYYYDEEYILSVSAPSMIFSEFSDPEISSDYFELFLKEHSKIIKENDAVNFVKNTF